MESLLDPLPLAQALLRCPSVTPQDAGAQDVLMDALGRLGFTVTRLRFGAVQNFFARIGTAAPHFCFAGHTDVVPAGEGWRSPPFAAALQDGMLTGRGACDMKGAIAAFTAAAARHLQEGPPRGSISLLISGDEEGDAIDGTAKVLAWMLENGHRPDFCLVGEPTNPTRIGELIKTGRRGSLTAQLTVHGTQGHVAYPHRADNPVHRLVHAIHALTAATLDAGTPDFEPSTLQVTTIDVGNEAANVIPAAAHATLNIRFNPSHSAATLETWLRETVAPHCPDTAWRFTEGARPFTTRAPDTVSRLSAAIARVTGFPPRADTGGGTSDARFIAPYAPVAEFGLVGASMHKVDEHVPVADLSLLTDIYAAILREFLP